MKFLIAGFGSIGRIHFRNLISLGERDILFLRSHKSNLPDEEIAAYPMFTEIKSALAQNPDTRWQQEKASEIAGILQKGKQGFWKDMFTARDRDNYWSIAGETLTKWGYLR